MFVSLQVARFGAKAVLFLFSLLVMLAGTEGAFRTLTTSYEEEKFRALGAEVRRHGTLLLGSSTTLNGVDPQVMAAEGVEAFNFAFQGAGPHYYARWLTEVPDRPRPRVVLLGADWFVRQSVLWRRLEHDSEHLGFPTLLAMTRHPENHHRQSLNNALAMLKHRSHVHAVLAGRFRSMPDYYRRGFQARGESYRLAEIPRRGRHPKAESSFRLMLETLEREGTETVFFQPPSYLPAVGSVAADNQYLERLAARFEVPFLNYNGALRSALNEDPSLFADPIHLNSAGSNLFSKTLSRDLLKRGLLSPV